MLAIVRLALAKPYSFVVLAILIVLLGPLAAMRTPTDIFPDIKIPVIGVIWTYAGLSAGRHGRAVSSRTVRAYTHLRRSTTSSTSEASPSGVMAIVKIYFQPNVDIRTATAQVTSVSQTVLKQMPPGMHAAADPELQRLHRPDHAARLLKPKPWRAEDLRHRPELHPPGPGQRARRRDSLALRRQDQRRSRSTSIRQLMQAKGLSPQDVGAALADQNQIMPAGTGQDRDLRIRREAERQPEAVDELNDLPDQDRERRHHLYPRRGPRARRQSAADQRRARRRPRDRC